jgi:Bacterial Ig-like domain/PKD domain
MTDARNLARPILAVLLAFALLLACAGSALAAPPAPVITSPAQGSYTGESEPAFGGSAEDEADAIVLNVYAGSTATGSPVETLQSLLPPIGGSWFLTSGTSLSDGEYTAVAEQTNLLEEASASDPVSFVVDTTPPAVSIDPVPTPTTDATPTLEGSAGTDAGDEAAVTVTLHKGPTLGGTVVGSAEASVSGGHWTLDVPHLNDGTYTVAATQRDQAGNVGDAEPVTFTVDTKAPAPSIDAVSSPSKDSSPTLEGQAGSDAGDAESVTVTVRRGGETVVAPQPVAVGAGGSWSFTVPALADGAYTAEVTQADQAGNTGQDSTAFTIDTVPPSVSLDAVSTPSSDVTPTLQGAAGTAPGDGATVTVAVHAGSSLAGPTVVSHTVSASGGAWSYTTPELADGTYTAQAVQSDEAGNVGKAEPVTFAVDTKGPSVSIKAVPSPTRDATPELEGTGGVVPGDAPGVSVAIHQGSSTGGPTVAGPQAVALSGGKWSLTASQLADGTYTAQVTQQDEAGNKASASSTFTIDTTAPAPSIDQPSSPSADATPTLSGTAGTAAGDTTSVTVTLHAGTIGGAVLGTPATVPASGGKWNYTTPQLADGTYAVQVTQSDQAGNTGEAGSVSFTIDTTKPALAIGPVATISNDTTPMLEGTGGSAAGDDPFVTVTVYEGAVGGKPVGSPQNAPVVAGAWSYTAPPLAPGTYAAKVVQKDAAGNVSAVSSTAFVIDTVAPAVTLEHPNGKTPELLARPVFSGKRGQALGDLGPVTLTIYEGSSVEGAPEVEKKVVTGGGLEWSTGAVETPLETGQIYTAVAEQRDEAGNVGRSQVVFTVKTDGSPTVTISTQGFANRGGGWFSRPGPTIAGTAGTGPEDGSTITVYFIRGGEKVKTMTTQRNGSEWSLGPVNGLEEGEYLLIAEQSGPLQPGTGHLALTIDGQAPAPAVTVPANGSALTNPGVQVMGTASSAPGDAGIVTVRLFAGATTESPQLSSIALARQGNAWSGSFEGLSPGTYTVQAEQGDDVGNAGLSAPSTFTVRAVTPVASFQWIPSNPHVGEAVSLISTSTDPVYQITAFAWDLAGSGTFGAGESIAHVTFNTPGDHVVRLRVTDSAGASATTAATIAVARTATAVLSPFPVVRIAGAQTAAGARISLLTVQAPLGATVSISCHGRGCPAKPVSLLATTGKRRSKAGSVLIPFPRFERALHAGAVLEIRVTKAGQIGKYTRFTVRGGKLPRRVDMCLSLSGVKPIVCPS